MMNEKELKALLRWCDDLADLSYPLCEHNDRKVSSNACKINKNSPQNAQVF